MGRSRNRKEHEEDEQTIQELKEANRRLKSDNRRLKAELETFKQAFNKTATYLKGNTDNLTVETIIEGVNNGNTLKEIKTCAKCKATDSVKEHKIQGVGILRICTNCNDRAITKRESNGLD
jgi:hypothetical protein